MSDEYEGDRGRTPTFAELAEAMKVLAKPEAPNLSKHISTVVVAAVIALSGWVMMGVNSLQQTVTQAVSAIQSIQKTVDDMSRRSEQSSDKQAATETSIARIEQRVETLEHARQDTPSNAARNPGYPGPEGSR